MVVRGEIVNSPSDKTGERKVANTLQVISTAPEGDGLPRYPVMGFDERNAPSIPLRTAIICATMLTAISSGVWEPIATPIGLLMRPMRAGSTPEARNPSSTTPTLLRAPEHPEVPPLRTYHLMEHRSIIAVAMRHDHDVALRRRVRRGSRRLRMVRRAAGPHADASLQMPTPPRQSYTVTRNPVCAASRDSAMPQ